MLARPTHIVSSLARPGEIDKELDEGIDGHQLVQHGRGSGGLDGLRHVGEGPDLLQQHRHAGVLRGVEEQAKVLKQGRQLAQTRAQQLRRVRDVLSQQNKGGRGKVK